MSVEKRALLKDWLTKAHLKPLTFSQRELWEASPFDATDCTNHIGGLIWMQGVIAPQACEAALQKVVDRQEVMRLSILPGKERPIQLIRPEGRANIRFRELSSRERHPEAVEDLAKEICSKPFDLVQGPLYRTEVLQLGAEDHVLVFAIHHAIADGWTLGVFVQDLCNAYVQELIDPRKPLLPIPLTYSAWGASERNFWQPAQLEKRAAFWQAQLDGRKRWGNYHPGTPLGPLHQFALFLPVELADSARSLARANGATLFSTLLTAFQFALSRWRGEEDVVVGTPVANRTKQTMRETMGYCAGIVPLRWQVQSDRPFSDTLQAVHQMTVESFANAMPFAELVLALQDQPSPGYNPVFDVRFALQNHPVPDITMRGLSFRLRMCSSGTARFHLACEITEDEKGLRVIWLFRPVLFPEAEIQKLAYMFQSILTAACRSPESRTQAMLSRITL